MIDQGAVLNRFDRRNLRRSFTRASDGYDAAAGLQRQVADNLLERLEYIRIQPSRILDAGTGTGYCARWVASRYRDAEVLGLDLSRSMLEQSRRRAPRWFSRHRYVGADVAAIPLASSSVDLVISSLTLQWCDDLARVFAELRRVLRPGGLLMFATFGPDTLRELRDAWSVVDTRVHVNRFVDMHEVGDLVMASGFRDVVMDADRIHLAVPDVVSLMRNIKAVGAHNVQRDRPRGLTGKRSLQRLRESYDRMRLDDGTLPVTYEAVYAHAWAPEAPGHVSIPFDGRHPHGR